ncbi:hypothetical protein ACQ4PT_064007 [Festuca glaucescens]
MEYYFFLFLSEEKVRLLSNLYKLYRFGGVSSPNAEFIWGSRAPSRAKFFAWLLVQLKVHTRDVLPRKNIMSVGEAGCLLCDTELETLSHMAFHCPAVAPFLVAISVSIPSNAHIQNLHQLPVPSSVRPETAPAFVLLCSWHLWKQRNGVVFREA